MDVHQDKKFDLLQDCDVNEEYNFILFMLRMSINIDFKETLSIIIID